MAFINQDFRFQESSHTHPRLRWALFAAASVVLGVVIANTNDSGIETLKASTDDNLDNTVDITLPILDKELPNVQQAENEPDSVPFNKTKLAPSTVARLSFQLSLPELQAQQSIIDDINHVTAK
ncbi:MAG: hypothetical protein OEZ15_07305, partial [Gammaproteobacteria bacterium]|nr:hypothetical protein [Gammaproteobacteria bacterium]